MIRETATAKDLNPEEIPRMNRQSMTQSGNAVKNEKVDSRVS